MAGLAKELAEEAKAASVRQCFCVTHLHLRQVGGLMHAETVRAGGESGEGGRRGKVGREVLGGIPALLSAYQAVAN